MKCPKCGYKRQLRDNAYMPRNECPACGAVYSKSGYNPYAQSAHAALPITSQKSPVHESSLQQARARVESKLRKQMEKRLKDERHQQTLARAKQITAAEMRKREEKLKRNQGPPESGPPRASDTLKIDTEAQADTPYHQTAGPEASPPKNKATLAEFSAEDTLSEVLPEDFILEDLSVNDTLPVGKPMQKADASAGISKTKASAKATKRPKRQPSVSPGVDTSNTLTSLADIPDKAPTKTDAASRTPSIRPSVVNAPIDRELADEVSDAAMAHTLGQRAHTALSNGLTGALPIVAWLILTAGLIGAVLSWTTIGDVEASVRHGVVTQSQGAMPLGLLLGFAYLATGVLGFAFFWVTSMMSRQLKDIRRLLLIHPVQTSSTEK
jgi:hypothetical protein